MSFSLPDIADAIQSGLQFRLHQIDLEQAVYGLDSLAEVALHPALAAALLEAGFGVYREQRYPADRRKRSHSEGERCDFVLTADARPLKHPDAAGTLFDPADAAELADAFWLEVKIVWQFTVEGPNPRYASELLATVRRDVTKLSKDPGILHAGLLIIMFVQDDAVAEHDLKVWQDRCLMRGLPIGAPARRTLPIADRHGNACCALAVYPVNHLLGRRRPCARYEHRVAFSPTFGETSPAAKVDLDGQRRSCDRLKISVTTPARP